MVLVRGVNLYPSALEAVVRRFSEIAEYRVDGPRSSLHGRGDSCQRRR